MALSFRKITEGLRILPKTTLTSALVQKGDLQVQDDVNGKLYYNNGSNPNSAGSPIVTESYSATLTNKVIDADLNTLSNIDNADIKAAANIARSKLASGTNSSVVVNNASGVMSDLVLAAGQVLLGNASGIPTPTSITGEVSINSSGVASVGTVANSVISGLLRLQMESVAVDSTIAVTKSFVRLTPGAGPIEGIVAGVNGQYLVLLNLSGVSLVVINESTSTGLPNRIVTGTGTGITLSNGSSIILVYNSTDQFWYVVGGVGSGGSPVSIDTQIVGTDIDWSNGDTFYKLISSNTSFTFSNVTNGKTIAVSIKNTGASDITLTFPSALTSGILNLIVSPGKENIYTFVRSNNKTYVSVISNFQ